MEPKREQCELKRGAMAGSNSPAMMQQAQLTQPAGIRATSGQALQTHLWHANTSTTSTTNEWPNGR